MSDQEQITAYFLSALSSEETERLEQACFNDQIFAESVLVVEEDLIDRYVRNELAPDEHKRFEEFYLTTKARCERVQLARMLEQEPRRPED